MRDPRELQERDRAYSPSNYAEEAIDARRAFVPHNQVRVIDNADRMEAIRETYRLLAVAVFAAMATCWFTSQSAALAGILATKTGWILSLIGLNVIPMLAASQKEMSSRSATFWLALDGAVSGFVLTPLVFLALMLSNHDGGPNLVQSALVITGAVFLGVSGFVYQSTREFNWGKGAASGIFWALLAGMGVNALWLHDFGFSMMLSGVIGVLGTLQLLWATSTVLRNPEFREPHQGALMLFAGLFNVFTTVLRLLIGSQRR